VARISCSCRSSSALHKPMLLHSPGPTGGFQRRSKRPWSASSRACTASRSFVESTSASRVPSGTLVIMVVRNSTDASSSKQDCISVDPIRLATDYPDATSIRRRPIVRRQSNGRGQKATPVRSLTRVRLSRCPCPASAQRVLSAIQARRRRWKSTASRAPHTGGRTP